MYKALLAVRHPRGAMESKLKRRWQVNEVTKENARALLAKTMLSRSPEAADAMRRAAGVLAEQIARESEPSARLWLQSHAEWLLKGTG
jgi:hypothetical protein